MHKPLRLHGLTQEQRELVEIMWSLKKTEELEEWFLELNEEEQFTVKSLAQLLRLEMIEHELENSKMAESKAIISKMMKK